MRYFVSDPHFNHRRVIEFERTQFKTIEEHDEFLRRKFLEWAKKVKPQDEFYVLGDWGDVDFLSLMKYFNCKTIMVAGNHDNFSDKAKFEEYFDEVHWYPYFISQKILVSHYPENVWPTQINIHGHLHGMKIADNNHICCSLNDINYNPVTDKQIQTAFSKLRDFQMRFLYEPYSYVLPQQLTKSKTRNDLVTSPDGYIDVSASRLLQKKLRDERFNNE